MILISIKVIIFLVWLFKFFFLYFIVLKKSSLAKLNENVAFSPYLFFNVKSSLFSPKL